MDFYTRSGDQPISPGFALEPRYMFDAAGLATGGEAASEAAAQAEAQHQPNDGDDGQYDAAFSEALTLQGGAREPDQLVIVDPAVEGYDDLLVNLEENAAVVILPENATLDDLAASVAGYENLSAIHVISHGDIGRVQIGGTILTIDNLDQATHALRLLGGALSETGDLLLYGCDIGADGAGTDFIEALSEATDADVAASDDLTGAEVLGADWDLEVSTGSVDVDLPFSATAVRDFSGVLSFAGTLTFATAGNFTDTGGTSGANDDVAYTAGAYSLQINGADASVRLYNGYIQSSYGGLRGENRETSLSISFAGGESFNPQTVSFTNYSVDAVAGNSEAITFIVTANDGTNFNQSVGADSTVHNIDLTQLGTGITSFSITRSGGGSWKYFNFDNFSVSNVAAVVANARPELGGTPGDVTINEDSTDQQIDLSAYNVSDADGDTVTLTLGVSGGSIGSVDGNGTHGGVTVADSGTGSMTLQGAVGDLNAYLNDSAHIVYTPVANFNGAVTLTVTPSDAGGAGDADTVTINVTAQNDNPVINNLSGDGVAYTEGTPVKLDTGGNATLTDVDSPVDLAGGTVTVQVTGAHQAGEDILSVDGTNVTLAALTAGSNVLVGGTVIGTLGSTVQAGNTLTITLNGDATLARVTTLLQNLTYDNSSDDPNTTNRTVSVTVTDGDGGTATTATVTVGITRANDAPTVTATGGTTAFTEGDGATVIDGAVTVTDPDSTTLSTATVGITGNFQTGEDVLAFTNDNATMGNIAGNYVAGTGILTLTSAGATATLAEWQAALRAVTYNNTSGGPDTNPRTITFAANDGSDTGAGSTRTVSVAGVNNVPTLGGAPNDVTVDEDVLTDIDLSAYNVADGDGDTVTLTLAVTGGTLSSAQGNGTTGGVTIANSGTATMTLQGSVANLNTYLDTTTNIRFQTTGNDTTSPITLTVTPADGAGNATADTVGIIVTAVNDQPTLGGTIGGTFTELETTTGTGNAFAGGSVALISGFTLTDPDTTTSFSGSTLVIAITGSQAYDVISLPVSSNGVAYNSGTGVIQVDGTTVGTLAGGNGATATLTFNGNATAAFIQRVANEVVYNVLNTDRPTAETRTVTATFSDNGNGGSGGAQTDNITGNLVVVATNDTPDFTGLDGTPSYTEDGAAVVLDADVTVLDSELDQGGDYAGATLVLVRNGGVDASDTFSIQTGGNLVVAGSNISSGGNVIAAFDTASVDGQVTITFQNNGTAVTTALVNEVMQAIRYSNDGNDPTSPTATPQIDWTFNDKNSGTQGSGGEGTGTGSITVTLNNVSDAPTLAATGGNPTFTEGGAAVDLFNTVAADTIEAADRFTAMTLTVTNVTDGAFEILNFDGSVVSLTNGNAVNGTATNGLNVSVAVVGTTATVSFTGANLTSAQMQTLVDGMTYQNNSQDPTTGANRVVTITGITDSGADGGANTAAPNPVSTVTLTPVNDPPVITSLNGDATGLQVNTSANIDDGGNAALANDDSANYDGGSLMIVDNGGNNNSGANGNFSVDGTTVTSGGDGTLAGGETISVGGTDIGTVNNVNDGRGGNSLQIDFNASATSADIQTLMRNLAWGASAGTGAQTFTLTINDADGTANGGDEDGAANFTMTIGNAPTLADLSGDTVTFNETGPVKLDLNGDAVLADADNPANFNTGSVVVQITGGAQATQDILTVDGTTVTVASDNAGANLTVGGQVIGTLGSNIAAGNTLTINLNGNATLARVQTLLQNISYDNRSEPPITGDRTVSVTVTDDGGLQSTTSTVTVQVQSINEAPTLGGVDNTPTYTEDGAAVVLDNNITITDAESDATNYNGASITLQRQGGTNAEDVFSNTGTLSALTQGSDFTVGGTTVGTVTTNSGGTLVLTFNTNATQALVQATLRQIAYSNTSDNPNASETIAFDFNDGNTAGTQGTGGALADTDDAITVTITDADDAPVVAGAGTSTANPGVNTITPFDGATITDVDSNSLNGVVVTLAGGYDNALDVLQFANDNATMGNIAGAFNAGAGTMTLTSAGNTATPAEFQAALRAVTFQTTAEAGTPDRTVQIVANDGNSNSAAANGTISVEAPAGDEPAAPPPPPPPAPPPAAAPPAPPAPPIAAPPAAPPVAAAAGGSSGSQTLNAGAGNNVANAASGGSGGSDGRTVTGNNAVANAARDAGGGNGGGTFGAAAAAPPAAPAAAPFSVPPAAAPPAAPAAASPADTGPAPVDPGGPNAGGGGALNGQPVDGSSTGLPEGFSIDPDGTVRDADGNEFTLDENGDLIPISDPAAPGGAAALESEDQPDVDERFLAALAEWSVADGIPVDGGGTVLSFQAALAEQAQLPVRDAEMMADALAALEETA